MGCLLGLAVVAQIAVGLRQLGKGQSKGRILFRCGLELFLRFEILAVSLKGDALVVVAQGGHRFSAGLKRTGLQLFEHIVRQCQFLADGISQAVHCAGNFFFARDIDFNRNATIVLHVEQSSVNPDLVAEFGVLAPNHAVGATKICHPADGLWIERGVGGNVQVSEDLVHPVGAHGAHAG